MKSTICTEAGRVVIQARAGRVESNGIELLPHEAMLIASELHRAAVQADQLATIARFNAKPQGLAA
jgi:hypothetical protein